MTKTSAEIQAFTIDIAENDLQDLLRRINQARLPNELPGVGRTRGVPLSEMTALAEYWQSSFDWRKQEAQLNELPQFTTTIDGQQIHFVHVTSPEADATPLLLCHGWPGSFVDFQKVIGPLTDPRSYGGDPSDAFHVVVPSLPGFGFSNPVKETGWSTGRMASALAELMNRLGYERYGVQGGDIGAGVTGFMASIAQEHVIGAHANTDRLGAAATAGMFIPLDLDSLTSDEQQRLQEMKAQMEGDDGYLRLQSTRPQTIAYALNDSPIGQLAWMAEKFQKWTDPQIDALTDAIDIDQFLTNVSIYWFTGSGASSAHAVYEGMNAQEWGGESSAPQGIASYGGKDPLVRKLVDGANQLPYWAEYDNGGHFPAWEAPEQFTNDLRSFFRQVQ